MSDNTNQANYIGKTPLLRPLNNLSGQFFLFQQYSNDLTKFLGHPAGNMPIPTTFYCLNLKLPDIHAHDNDYIDKEDPDSPYTPNVQETEATTMTPVDPVDPNPDNDLDSKPRSAATNEPMSIEELTTAPYGLLCKELMYKGDVNIFGTDTVDGIGYNEIYCHVDNDAQRQKFNIKYQVNQDYSYGKNHVIGYGPQVRPSSYEFSDYGTYIGDILQNEYENGNTFFNMNFTEDLNDDISWDTNYYLGRLLYVLYRNGMITLVEAPEDQSDNSLYNDEPDVSDYQQNGDYEALTEASNEEIEETEISLATEDTPTQAGVLSNKALFEDTKTIDEETKRGIYRFFKTNQIERTNLNKIKFQFNAILVCYGLKNNTNNTWENNTEIPMGLYFTGFDKNPNDETDLGDFVNAFTKYYKNIEIYNQGTSYTLRLCTRTLTSQATDNHSEVITNVISASNTGEWVNEYEFLMSKFDETYNTLQNVKNQYASMYDILHENLDRFRNNRTNVPYVRTVNSKKFWFVNGVNTLQEITDAADAANWNNEDDRVLPAFQKVTITSSAGEDVTISPEGTHEAYLGTAVIYSITITNGMPLFTVEPSSGTTLTYDTSIQGFFNGGVYYDTVNKIYIREIEQGSSYQFTFMSIEYGCRLTVTKV